MKYLPLVQETPKVNKETKKEKNTGLDHNNRIFFFFFYRMILQRYNNRYLHHTDNLGMDCFRYKRLGSRKQRNYRYRNMDMNNRNKDIPMLNIPN